MQEVSHWKPSVTNAALQLPAAHHGVVPGEAHQLEGFRFAEKQVAPGRAPQARLRALLHGSRPVVAQSTSNPRSGLPRARTVGASTFEG